MKLPVVFLVATLALNVGLFATLAVSPPASPAKHRAGPGAAGVKGNPAREKAATGRTPAAVHRASPSAPKNWADLDTEDLHELAARLRSAGFPNAVVRAVIAARVEALFAPRMKELFSSVQKVPIWQQDPRLSFDPKIMEGRNQLMLERTRMVRDALGTNFLDSEPAGRRAFGDIPPNKIELVQRIDEDYAEMISQVRASMRGIILPEDREKLALLERERKADLAGVLSPEELDAYELRNSPVTNRLRPALTVMDATEDEFRAIFRVYEPLNDRLNPNMATGAGVVPTSFFNDRRAATTEMMAQMKSVLPPERYAAFERAQDREYQQLDAITRQNNLPPDAAVRAFGLRDRYSAESMRLAEDRSMPPEQKTAALQSLAADARAQILNTLGAKAGADYVQSASWLNAMESGRAFTMIPGGGMSMRAVSVRVPPPKK